MADFGEHVRDRRMVLGLSQQVAAARAGVSIPTLRAIEEGSGGSRLDSVFKVLDVLGIAGTMTESIDPLRTELGVARASMLARKRAPRRSRTT
ncbi:helix-turn-helix domain-containing protein [Agrococcus sp. 1P02AA]|uniref:helix-turn-helix domain-containing protein n=1 Tax=Agrococcus sp. 1P02AA TaxID=3132259 RepID=UPI0039A56B95